MMRNNFQKTHYHSNRSVSVVAVGFFILGLWIVAKLFVLQVVQHDYYSLFAASSHEIYEKVHPVRGTVYFQDVRTKDEYPAAVERTYYLIYAVPREIEAGKIASIGLALSNILHYDATQSAALLARLSKSTSAYEVIAKKVDDGVNDQIKAANLQGIYVSPQEFRYFPEENSGANVLGFVRLNADNVMTGQYGVEGYWNDILAGKNGLLSGEQGANGNWITLSNRKILPAQNGADLLLTIDRALQYKACERLRQGMVDNQAQGAALVILNPKTGAILAMCSMPDFDPNNFSSVSDLGAFNNTSIFGAYEPGSVFKPIAMAGAIDQGLVSPDTTYTDPCERKIDKFTIRNADKKCWGVKSMTEVLKYSINTGMMWVEEKLGKDKFKQYVTNFGFGEKTGVGLASESSGDISAFDKKSHVYDAVASFGQGITATPLQIAAAYGAIANQGALMRPYVVQEVRYASGKKDIIQPELIGQVLSPRTTSLLSGMLVAVVDNYGARTHVPGYYVAGKTGTAQVADRGGYAGADITNQTFAGFAPADNPQFVVVVKYDKPNTQWAELSAGPVFSDVMKFALDYYGIPKQR